MRRALVRSVGVEAAHSRIAGSAGTRVLCPRFISIRAAKELLGFGPQHRPTMRELRAAYFEAAKQTHPDVMAAVAAVTPSADKNNKKIKNGTMDFVQVTLAYERLLDSREIENDVTWKISHDEQEEYRRACQAVLGIPAEIVEESKQNPMFRRWLDGNTDGAQHWRAFFSANGGLAQKLQAPVAFLESGQEELNIEARPRRRRGR